MNSPRFVLGRCVRIQGILPLLLAWGCCQVAADGEDLSSLWRAGARHQFRQAASPGIGFSLVYDGKPAGPAPLAGWQLEMAAEGAESSFRHPSGLTVLRQARAIPEFAAIEYTLRLRNDGRADLPALAAIHAMDLSFEGDLANGISVVWCGGGGADAKFPPKDFAVTRTALGPSKDSLTLGAAGGMPSRVQLPFFFVENEARAAGLFVAIGWTGQWQATIRAERGANRLHLQAGIPGIDLRLRPGEEISGPHVLIGCYDGPLSSGTNALRRLIRDRYAPSVGGQRLVAPILYTTWFDVGAELDEKLARGLVDRAAEMGQEIFLVDAGWYKGTPSRPYGDMAATWEAISGSLGNWEQGEDPARFPSGLRWLAEYVRTRGMHFGLWFEPERCGPQSLLAREHSDWVTYIPGRKWGLVDFGNPAVQDYFCKIFDRYIGDLGIRFVRWDMNHNDQFLLSYWEVRDAPGRRGISQIRHVEGLHRVEDYIRRHHPAVIVESCAGGGNRIDLATLQRRHAIWISDQKTDPQITRFHLEGLNQFIPGTGQGVALALSPGAVRQPGFVLPDITSQCCFGGAFGLRGRLHEWPVAVRQSVRRNVEVYKTLRRFLSEDFYLLAPQAGTLDTWAGWQFHDPRTGEGFVQAFRTGSPRPSTRFPLHGLDPAASYQFSDPYTGQAFEVSGAAAMAEGLKFDLPPMSSRVLTYRKTLLAALTPLSR